jgi:hypothetical protein
MVHGTLVFTTEAQRTQRGSGERQSVFKNHCFLRYPSVFSVSLW